MEWTKVSKEVIDKVPEIILLKKGELQVKYAEALVKIDKVLQIIKECKMLMPHEFDWEEQIDNIVLILQERK